jgi:AraC-like DNA-binding protein
VPQSVHWVVPHRGAVMVDHTQPSAAADAREAVVFTTEHLPVEARADRWRRAIGTPFPGLAVDWLSDEPIAARFESHPFAAARVTEIRNTPVRVVHRPTREGVGDYQLVLHLAGHGSYAQNGREVIQEAGDLVLLDTALPFVSTFEVSFGLLVWNLPRASLAPLLSAPDAVVARRIRGNHGPGALLGTTVRALAAEIAHLDAELQRQFQTYLFGLTALSVGASGAMRETRRMAYRAARRQQLLTYIDVHFRDEGLTVDRAARDLGISRRWLHTLLEGSGAGFAARVAARRLEACREMLEDSACDGLSIAEIAFGCGFGDLSTFNRRFRTRYGVSPRQVRRSRAGPDNAVARGGEAST